MTKFKSGLGYGHSSVYWPKRCFGRCPLPVMRGVRATKLCNRIPKTGREIMLWRGERQSSNIEDRRGMRVGTGLVGGGLGGLILLLISLYFGMDPSAVVNPDTAVDASGPASTSPADQETKDFVATVVGYTEDTWSDLFQRSGQTYRPPKLVLFTGAAESACGFAQAAMGPFYCPDDERVYLDMSFFQESARSVSRSGRFCPGLRHRA